MNQQSNMKSIVSRFVAIAFICGATATNIQADTKQQDAAWAIIDRALEAHGGHDKVMAFKAGMWTVEGTLQMPTGPAKIAAVMSLQPPHKSRTELQLILGEQKVTYTTVVNGDQGWMQLGAVSTPMPATALVEAKRQLYTTLLAMFLPLKDRDQFALSLLPEKEVADETAVGVRIKREGSRTVDLYFNKLSGLRVSSEHEIVDELTRTLVRQETIYSAYQDYDGVQQPVFTTIKRDGKVFMVAQLKKFVASEQLDEKLFQPKAENDDAGN